MNLSPITVVIFGAGAVLIYCAIKDQSPKDVLLFALGKAPAASTGTGKTQTSSATVPTIPTVSTKGTITSV